MLKPRIYWTYYPKMRRGFWRVNERPNRDKANTYPMWERAHAIVNRMNRDRDRAEQTDLEARVDRNIREMVEGRI